MRFYNREKELQNLCDVKKASLQSSKMTVIVGRRRIGKTKLIKEANEQMAYLFVSKKDETMLCAEFVEVPAYPRELDAIRELAHLLATSVAHSG